MAVTGSPTFVPAALFSATSRVVLAAWKAGRALGTILCAASIATAAWSRTALLVVLPVAVMVPPLSVSLSAAIAMPFGAESPITTV